MGRRERHGFAMVSGDRPAWREHFTRMKTRFGRTIRCDFFLRFRSKKTPPPIRPEVMLMAEVLLRCSGGYLYRTAEMLSEKYVEWTDDMAGGPTRTSWLCHGERRPSGVA